MSASTLQRGQLGDSDWRRCEIHAKGKGNEWVHAEVRKGDPSFIVFNKRLFNNYLLVSTITRYVRAHRDAVVLGTFRRGRVDASFLAFSDEEVCLVQTPSGVSGFASTRLLSEMDPTNR